MPSTLKMLTAAVVWIYDASPTGGTWVVPSDVTDNRYLYISGGVGWTPGYYKIGQVAENYVTPDGIRNIGFVQLEPAAPGVSGGIGELVTATPYVNAHTDVIVLSNSFFAGYTDTYDLFPALQTYMGTGYNLIDSSTGGITTATLLSEFYTRVTAKLDTLTKNGRRKVLVLFEGINSLFFGESVANTTTQLQSIITLALQDGRFDEVVWLPLTIRSAAGTPGTYAADYVAVNNNMFAWIPTMEGVRIARWNTPGQILPQSDLVHPAVSGKIVYLRQLGTAISASGPTPLGASSTSSLTTGDSSMLTIPTAVKGGARQTLSSSAWTSISLVNGAMIKFTQSCVYYKGPTAPATVDAAQGTIYTPDSVNEGWASFLPDVANNLYVYSLNSPTGYAQVFN